MKNKHSVMKMRCHDRLRNTENVQLVFNLSETFCSAWQCIDISTCHRQMKRTQSVQKCCVSLRNMYKPTMGKNTTWWCYQKNCYNIYIYIYILGSYKNVRKDKYDSVFIYVLYYSSTDITIDGGGPEFLSVNSVHWQEQDSLPFSRLS